jgi:F-type H+-transporting ATPase subunit a
VRRSICIDMLGEARGRRYAPFIGLIFIGVLGMNLTGIVPGINIAASSVMAVPLVFAALAYVGFIAAGIRAQGAGRFFASQLLPPGVPKVVYLLITPIECFSTFVVRPATLAIRLLANMISGHFLLAMTYFGTSALLAAAGGMKGLAALTGLAAVAVTLFELFIAVLQAYIFAVLTTVYIKMSVESH